MKILEEFKIGDLNLKNRIIMAPMGPELGDFDERTNNYYIRRAEGGASMVVINVLATKDFDGPGPSALLTEESYDGFKKLVDGCHSYDCKVCIQIMPGVGLGQKADNKDFPSSASATEIPGTEYKFQELSKDEITFIQDEVLKTALLAKKAGVDAIEIHAYGGYLTDRFMTEVWNVRNDEYGGSFENRMRFLIEIIDSIQDNLTVDFPLFVKYTPEHLLPSELGYRNIDEGIKIAKLLESKSIHALHIDVGCHANWYRAMPPIYQQDAVPQLKYSKIIKDNVNIPIISNGRLGDIGKAESALESEYLDILAVGRQFLADPDFPNKIKENRADDIRYCIYCNEGCIKSVTEGNSINCAVNPIAGYEGIKEIVKTDNPKNILVIGAGPAGCEAAISHKKAGHNVEIWEREDKIGGNFYSACMPYFKRDGIKLINSYKIALDKLDIDIKYNKEATVKSVLEYNADKVINAAGGNPIRPRSIKGIEKTNVVTAIDVLQNRVSIGENIVIIGAGLVGCETGLVLDSLGKNVTVIEMMDRILPEAVWIQNLMMLNILIDNSKLVFNTSSKLLEIKDDSVVFERNGKSETLNCDTVVLAMGFSPNNKIYEELKDKINIVNVGDSVAPRKVLNAVHEAFDTL